MDLSGRLYRPRKAQASPLYRVAQDWLETFVSAGPVDEDEGPARQPAPCAESSLRAFLECGVPRFGVVRFRCESCGDGLFVPYSCKKRLACPSCDGKRSAITAHRALDELLPRVPCRQWVLTLPKRLRYFIHRDPRLIAPISRILTAELTAFYRAGTGAGPCAAPTLLQFVQRFGSSINIHVHWHLVVSDGTFEPRDGCLAWRPAAAATPEQVERLVQRLRRRILAALLRVGAIPQETAEELLARPHGGFSLDASVRVEAEDRDALRRLLLYCTRPAIAVNRLQYLPEHERVRYRPIKGKDEILEWSPLQFLGRLARIIPAPYLNLVRYAGALGPRSRLRLAVCAAAKEGVEEAGLLKGWSPPPVPARVAALARKLASAATRAWARCLARIFEVYPLRCDACGVDMIPTAAITSDGELTRLLLHLGLPVDFPVTSPARAPPLPLGGDSQVDPAVDRWDGIDLPEADGWASA